MAEILLEMRNITKTFPGVKALDNVNLKVEKGEIHALVGENGAGKSTLMNVLSGIYPYGTYEGDIIYDGQVCKFDKISDSEEKGIVIIHQELALIPYMSIGENMYLGNEKGKKMAINWDQTYDEADRYLKTVGLNESSHTLIKDIGVGKQQLVEIAKAISNHVKILVLDEPTAAITDKETNMLFGIIRELQKEKIGIIYISHRMSELFEIGDRCTVMRDGEYIGTVRLSESSEDELTKMMVGRTVSFEKIANEAVDMNQVVLKVENLRYKDFLKDISFELHKGEILGFAGLVGAGRTEAAKCMIGAYRKNGGTVTYKGETLSNNLSRNIEKGIVYLSEDRKDEGLVDNIALPNLKRLAKPFIRKKEMADRAKDYIKSLRIKTHTHLTEARNLSGGNQQKVVIAKWLYSNADVYIFDEPTRGIDVGARDEIYNIMYDLVNQGASIIMISSDLVEVLKMCDRVAVMREGVLEAILDNDPDLTQETILKYAMQGGI